MKIEFKDVIIIILICIIIYAVLGNKIDHFTEFTPLEQQINNAFEVDMSGIRRLNEIIVDLENPDVDLINFNKYNVDQLILNNTNIEMNSNFEYNLDIGGAFFKDNVFMLNHNMVNIIPRGFIIAWYSKTIPSGWILCDGTVFWAHKYNQNIDTLTEPTININNYDKIQTPDLRGRFIVGTDNYDMFKQNTGGEYEVKITYDQMPQHTHNGTKLLLENGYDRRALSSKCNVKTMYNGFPSDDNENNILYQLPLRSDEWNFSPEGNEYVMPARDIFPDNVGLLDMRTNLLESTYAIEPEPVVKDGNTIGYNFLHTDMPHNNMPPFHCVYYIMKK